MTGAAWAGVAVSALLALVAVLAVIQRAATRDGKIDAVLEQLTELTADHEDRIRYLERRPPRRRGQL